MIDPLAALEEDDAKPVYKDPLSPLEVGKAFLKKGDLVKLKDSRFEHVQWRVLMTYTTGEGKIPMAQMQVIDVPTAHMWARESDMEIIGG